MAQDNAHVDLTFPANADLSAKQYLFVKLVTGGKVDVCAAVTDKPIGVLQNKPTLGQAANVRIFGITKVVFAGTSAIGDALGTDAAGKAATYTAPVATNPTKYIVAQGTVAAVANDVAQAFVDCGPVHLHN